MKQSEDQTREFVGSNVDKASELNLFGFLRALDALHTDQPRIGHSKSFRNDIVEFKQSGYLKFAPSTIDSLRELPPRKKGGPVVALESYFFGLCGPNGPMPLAIADYILARKNGVVHPDRVSENKRDITLNRRDSSLHDFLNIFNHRFTSFFYRAWASSSKTVDFDRPSSSDFTKFIGSFSGNQSVQCVENNGLSHNYFASHFSNFVKTSEGLAKTVSDIVGASVELIENVGHWITLPEHEREPMGMMSSALGSGAMIGDKVWDHQLKFNLIIGPVDQHIFNKFLPESNGEDSALVKNLKHLIALYTDRVFFCDLHVVLDKSDKPLFQLGSGSMLGYNTWISNNKSDQHPQDLKININ